MNRIDPKILPEHRPTLQIVRRVPVGLMAGWFALLIAAGLISAGLLGYQAGQRQAPAENQLLPTSQRPLIGIASLTSESYVKAVRESGGIPVVLPNTDFSDEVIAG